MTSSRPVQIAGASREEEEEEEEEEEVDGILVNDGGGGDGGHHGDFEFEMVFGSPSKTIQSPDCGNSLPSC
jgi:hypothetical protein